MSQNPIVRVRFWGNLALVLFTSAVMLIAVLRGPEIWGGWAVLLGAVALGYVALSVILHLRYPHKVDVAWDEQVMDSYRASLAFGYWVALGTFLICLILVLAGLLSPATAFFAMAPVLGVGPSVFFTYAAFRGRAG